MSPRQTRDRPKQKRPCDQRRSSLSSGGAGSRELAGCGRATGECSREHLAPTLAPDTLAYRLFKRSKSRCVHSRPLAPELRDSLTEGPERRPFQPTARVLMRYRKVLEAVNVGLSAVGRQCDGRHVRVVNGLLLVLLVLLLVLLVYNTIQ